MVVHTVRVTDTPKVKTASGFEAYQGEVPPKHPVANEYWFDTRTNTLYVWTGDRWFKVQ